MSQVFVKIFKIGQLQKN